MTTTASGIRAHFLDSTGNILFTKEFKDTRPMMSECTRDNEHHFEYYLRVSRDNGFFNTDNKAIPLSKVAEITKNRFDYILDTYEPSRASSLA